MFNPKAISAVTIGLAFIGYGSYQLIRLKPLQAAIEPVANPFVTSGWVMVSIGAVIVSLAALIGVLVQPKGGTVPEPDELIGRLLSAAPLVVGTWIILSGLALSQLVSQPIPRAKGPRLQAAMEDTQAFLTLMPKLVIGAGVLIIVGSYVWTFAQKHLRSSWHIPSTQDDFF